MCLRELKPRLLSIDYYYIVVVDDVPSGLLNAQFYLKSRRRGGRHAKQRASLHL